MQTLQNILSQQNIQTIGWTLINFIWQGTLIAFLLAIVLKFLRNKTSNTRYAIAFLALAIMIFAPIFTYRMIYHIPVAGVDSEKLANHQVQIIEPMKVVKLDLPQDNIKPVAPVKKTITEKFIQATETFLPHIVLCWLVGVIILSVWHLGGWMQLQKLRKQMISPVADEIKNKLLHLSKILGINKAVNIFQSVLVNVPAVIGHFKPVILLPASALTGLSSRQIDAILAHELAHIKRCDYLINILQTVVEILGFYHPAVWWVSNKIRQERENCCDDIAVQITGDEISYAHALTTMEEIRFLATENTETTEDINNKKLAVAASGGNLFQRIKRLVTKNSHENEKAGWLPSAITFVLIAALLIPMSLTLISCNQEKIVQHEMNQKLSKLDIDTATREDVIKVFGEPEKYMWGNEKVGTFQYYQKDNLPDKYVMFYPNDFRIFIANNQIVEFRFEGQSDYVFDGELVVGSSLEKVIKVLGEPNEILDGEKIEFKDNVLYKNIQDKPKGIGYYAVPQKHVRIWLNNDEVRAIYVTRSDYSDGGPFNKKLKDSELPKGSTIDAKGHIVDKIDYPFVNDPEVLGGWEAVDFVNDINNFKPGKRSWDGDLFLKELFFLDEGKTNWAFSWTKGLLLHSGDKTASKYIIKEINGSKYMFMEWKSGDYTIRHMKPSYYVLKKVEDSNVAEVPPHPTRPKEPPPPPRPYDPPTREMVVYEVNKSVSDFPADDFSTPQAAYAAINKVSANGDSDGWQRVSVKKLAQSLAAEKKNGKMKTDPEWSQVLLNAKINEVRIWNNKKAIVMAELPQSFCSKKIKAPIDVRWLEFENNKWLNSGNDRTWTIEEARAKFDNSFNDNTQEPDRTNQQKISDEKLNKIFNKPDEVIVQAKELFEKIKNADYVKFLNYYNDGQWKADEWQKWPTIGYYMVHTAYPDFVLWTCRTFKDNPIVNVELGEVYKGDRIIIGKTGWPTVPYKITLKDGSFIQGDLPFEYNFDGGKGHWHGMEGIDWHLQDDPIKKAPSIEDEVEQLTKNAEDFYKQVIKKKSEFKNNKDAIALQKLTKKELEKLDQKFETQIEPALKQLPVEQQKNLNVQLDKMVAAMKQLSEQLKELPSEDVVLQSADSNSPNDAITSAFNEFIKAVQINDNQAITRIAVRQANAYNFIEPQRLNAINSLQRDAMALTSYKGFENLTIASIQDDNQTKLKNVITSGVVDVRGIRGRLSFGFSMKDKPILETIHFVEDNGKQILLRPQVLISARIVSVPQNWPRLKEVTAPDKFFTPEELKQLLSEIQNVDKAKVLAAPRVLLNDGEEGLITTKNVEFKVKCNVSQGRQVITGDYNLKYVCRNSIGTISSKITMSSNMAAAIKGKTIYDGNELILIVQPKVLEAGEKLETGVAAENNSVPQKETTFGPRRPTGNCSISGKAVSAETNEPVANARMYLFCNETHDAIFINTATDGTFEFQNIPSGSFTLRSSHVAGYQDCVYDPENKSVEWPPFSLKDGEQRKNLIFKLKPAYSISGKILDENGRVPAEGFEVLAWLKKDGQKYDVINNRINSKDGTFLIDGLEGTPVYVMAINWQAEVDGNAYPPIYYPGTFSRDEAKLITFDNEKEIKNIEIKLKKNGGIVLEGTVTDEKGQPVSQAFVVVHHSDMLVDFSAAYTDQNGKYKIEALGPGNFLAHVDAVHKGYVRMRIPLEIKAADKEINMNFKLNRGVSISGKFVDENGNEWKNLNGYGNVYVSNKSVKDSNSDVSSFSLTNFRNKYRPKSNERSGGYFALGEGDYNNGEMIFPTSSTFILQGIMPGKTKISFEPKEKGSSAKEILYNGQNIKDTGLETNPGQEIKDVTIVIGKEDTKQKTEKNISDNFEILDVNFEPIHQGKNIVWITVKNTADKEQFFSVNVYSRSVDYGQGGVGWGTSFREKFDAEQTKKLQYFYKIQGPITKNTYTRLSFYKVNSLSFDDDKDAKAFAVKQYSINDLKIAAENKPSIKASKQQFDAVAKTLAQMQEYIKNKDYQNAWNIFTEQCQETDYQTRGFKGFKLQMEPQHRLDSAFLWEKQDFLKLKPVNAFLQNDKIALITEKDTDQWTITFVQQNGKWKIDWIAGYAPAVIQNWEDKVLPDMQKYESKHFDIYYKKDALAEKDIESISVNRDQALEKICEFLGTKFDKRIKLIFFEDANTKMVMTGHQGDGWSYDLTIVEVYNKTTQLDPFTSTSYIVKSYLGDPPALFNYGFSLYMVEQLGQKPLKYLGGDDLSLHQRVKQLKKEGNWIQLQELIAFSDIGPCESQPTISYAEAGSFTKFLIDNFGQAKFLQAYQQLKNSDDKTIQQQNIKKLEQIYNASLSELDNQWQTAIGIERHVQKEPMKKSSQTVNGYAISSTFTDEKPIIDIEARFVFVNENFLANIKDANFTIDVNNGSILNENQSAYLLSKIRNSNDANLLTAPKVTVNDGETANISVIRETAYISDYNETSSEPSPDIKYLQTGLIMKVSPKLQDRELVRLDLNFEYTDVNLENKKLYKEKYEYIVPETKKTTISNKVTLYNGQTIFLGAKKVKIKDDLKDILILIKAQKVTPPKLNV
ncbi:MAG: M56 family metallopeptidase [Phycisphaerales bacterium]